MRREMPDKTIDELKEEDPEGVDVSNLDELVEEAKTHTRSVQSAYAKLGAAVRQFENGELTLREYEDRIDEVRAEHSEQLSHV